MSLSFQCPFLTDIFISMGEIDWSGKKFVSRAGLKLAYALDKFGINPKELVCADFGANVGGFTDCLLQAGAKKVYAVDTSYGVLDYRLRRDPRVVVLERTNAMHVSLPELCDLITIDVGWTKQKHILPNARKNLKATSKVVSLVKPHYEADREYLKGGILSPQDAQEVFENVLNTIPAFGFEVVDWITSPIKGAGGNIEYLVLLKISDS